MLLVSGMQYQIFSSLQQSIIQSILYMPINLLKAKEQNEEEVHVHTHISRDILQHQQSGEKIK